MSAAWCCALAVEGGGVVRLEEDVEDLVIADHGRVVFHLDDLGVAGAMAADLLVGGILRVAAGVAADALDDARHALEDRLRAPEASAPEGGEFGFRRRWGLGRGGHGKGKEKEAGKETDAHGDGSIVA